MLKKGEILIKSIAFVFKNREEKRNIKEVCYYKDIKKNQSNLSKYHICNRCYSMILGNFIRKKSFDLIIVQLSKIIDSLSFFLGVKVMNSIVGNQRCKTGEKKTKL